MSKQYYSGVERPATFSSPVGKEVYEWQYYDKVGKLKQGKENTYEKIQSYKNQVDYKTRIKQAMVSGEDIGDIYGSNSNDIYMDTTKCDGTIDGALAFVQDSIKNEVERQQRTVDSGKVASQETSPIAENNAQGGAVGARTVGNETNGNGTASNVAGGGAN